MLETKEKLDNRARIEHWLKDLLRDDFDKFDWIAHYDATLSYVESKGILREKVKEFLATNLRESIEYTRAQQDKLLAEQISRAEAEVEEYNKNLSFKDDKNVDQYYSQIYRAVDKICEGHSNLVMIAGVGGVGKSVAIQKTLKKNNAVYVEVTGEVTEAYLYRLLYENNGKIIWFRDNANKLFSGEKSTIILKAATETQDVRVITKNNYSKQQEDLPDKFICKCRFIFDFNTLRNIVREDFEALVSRGDYIHFALSQDDMINIMKRIAKTKEEIDVTKYLVEKFKNVGIVRLNLRTQVKAFETFKYCLAKGLDWRKELDAELTMRISKDKALLYSLIGGKAVRRMDLKRILISSEICSSIRTADRMIEKWLFCQELFETTDRDRNGFVCINEVDKNGTN